MEAAGEAPEDGPRRCGNPACPDPTSTSRLQCLPKDFMGDCIPGAKHFHRQKGPCARWCGFRDAPKKAGRKRSAETMMAIPVGKQLDSDKCPPPILRTIDELWGCRWTSCPAHAYRLTRLTSAHIAVRRQTDIYDMPKEERSQPLANGSILEYIVHGEYAWKETDINSVYGAWWISLRTMVREVGEEAVEKKLKEFDDEVKRLRTQAIQDALKDSSSDDEDVDEQ